MIYLLNSLLVIWTVTLACIYARCRDENRELRWKVEKLTERLSDQGVDCEFGPNVIITREDRTGQAHVARRWD